MRLRANCRTTLPRKRLTLKAEEKSSMEVRSSAARASSSGWPRRRSWRAWCAHREEWFLAEEHAASAATGTDVLADCERRRLDARVWKRLDPLPRGFCTRL